MEVHLSNLTRKLVAKEQQFYLTFTWLSVYATSGTIVTACI